MEKLDNIHPGEVLREEFMMPLEITAYRLSKDLGIPKRDIQLDLSGGWMDTDGWYAGLGVSFRKK